MPNPRCGKAARWAVLEADALLKRSIASNQAASSLPKLASSKSTQRSDFQQRRGGNRGNRCWEPVDYPDVSLVPFGPETPKKPEKSLPGPPALERLEEVPTRLFRDLEFFSRLLGGPGPPRRETFFQTFSGFGPGGPETPL